MSDIKFGTDGWRAIIAQDFTVANVERVAEATAKWLSEIDAKPSVVVGYDCRFGGQLFSEAAAKVLCRHGVKTYIAPSFVSTPMVSLGVMRLKATAGIVITASHNPPSYNGFKLKGGYGGPLLPDMVAEIEALIPPVSGVENETVNLEEMTKKGLLEVVDLETVYCDHIKSSFDLDAINKSGIRLAYDAMFGAGQNVMRKLFPSITFLHAEFNPSFMGQAPEPIHKNLLEFSELIKKSGSVACGFATDGDADRIGLYDGKGNFVDSHHIILLLIHYLCLYKKQKGKVCVAFSVSPRVEKLCMHYKLPVEVVKIGFKYICEIMLNEDVLLGGEESGGIAIKGHIPERDGIWIGLTLIEFMAKSGKTLEDLIAEVYKIVGTFAYERSDLHLSPDLKEKILKACMEQKYKTFGKYRVTKTENLDGYKYFFENGDWMMIRASGTEPVLRTYAESSSSRAAFDILSEGKKTLLG